MTNGIDTDFIVAVEIREHPFHLHADALVNQLLESNHAFALAPQTLAEFIHVVTDPRRIPVPLSVDEAVARARHWWHAEEVIHVFPEGEATVGFLTWLREHRLGRKRLLDTLLAATFFHAGIRRVITNNEVDYRVFGVFDIIGYGKPNDSVARK